MEKITARFNSLELDNNKGPLSKNVDWLQEKVSIYIESWESFDWQFKEDFN